MYSRLLRTSLLLAGLVSAHLAWAQAPLTINNLTDQSTHNLRTWFHVPSSPGYTYQVLLDGQRVPTDLTHWVESPDYHELEVTRTTVADGSVTNRLVRFIVRSDRGRPENGLIRWTPYPPINSTAAEFAGAQLHIITPAAYPAGLPIPIIAWVDDDQGRERRANGRVTAPGFEEDPIQVLRGVGSTFLPAASAGASLEYAAHLYSLQAPKSIAIDEATSWTSVSGQLSESTAWPVNARILLEDHLTVPAGVTLSIGAGVIVQLAPLVNITNSGRIAIEGTRAQPVVFTAANVVWPEQPAGAWGGFLLRGSAAELIANGAIFAGGGGATSFSFSPGASHRSEQPVFLLHSGARAALTNCYVLNTAGQIGNGYESDLTLDHCLFQRAITAGEYVGGTITIRHSALIEFPNDDGVVDAEIADADFDAIYFTEGTHILENSLIGFAKDDALDSGSGGPGTMLLTNCWVESALHEAQAWSGEGRQTWTYDTVCLNSGQGIECGFSDDDHSPRCFADGLFSTANAVGARFGDNYDWSYNGFLRLTNCLLLYNYRDIFLKTWNDVGSGWQTNSWIDRLQQVDIQNNWLSTPWTNQPGNTLWNPAVAGWRLARWMTTPPDAAVGIGFAVRTNQFDLSDLTLGVPVRLSTFTTNFVRVDCAFINGTVRLGTSSLTFEPGETVKRVYPAGWDLFAYDEVELVLEKPDHGELTGETHLTFVGSLPPPTVGCWVATNTLPIARLPEGLLVRLSTPAGRPVNVPYSYTTDGILLAEGSVTFAPGQTVQHLDAIGIETAGREQIQFSLAPVEGASLSGIATVFYGQAPLLLSFAVSSNQLDLDQFANGLTLQLNEATSDLVSVDFACESSLGLLTNGTVTFDPGQIRQTLRLPSVVPGPQDVLSVSLTGVRNAQLAAPTNVLFLPLVEPFTPILIAGQSRWRYLDSGADLGTAWRSPVYSDADWASGQAQLGFNDGDEATTLDPVGTNGQNTITFYFRHSFTVEDPGVFTNLNLWLLRDDGGGVYLNGTEVYRSPTLPPPPTLIGHQTLANYLSVSDAPGDNSEDTADLNPALLVAGTNLVAVEIHQHRSDSSDISFDLSLTGEPTPPSPPQRLYWGRSGGRPILAWGDATFRLEQANDLAGDWTLVTEAASPWAISPLPAHRFYRLRR